MNTTSDIIVTLVFFVLFFLGVISFILFTRRLLVNSHNNKNYTKEMDHKLDKIIDLLEKRPN